MADSLDELMGFLAPILQQAQASLGGDRISTAVKVAVGFSTIAYHCDRMGESEIKKQAIELLRETMKGLHSTPEKSPLEPDARFGSSNAGPGSPAQ